MHRGSLEVWADGLSIQQWVEGGVPAELEGMPTSQYRSFQAGRRWWINRRASAIFLSPGKLCFTDVSGVWLTLLHRSAASPNRPPILRFPAGHSYWWNQRTGQTTALGAPKPQSAGTGPSRHSLVQLQQAPPQRRVSCSPRDRSRKSSRASASAASHLHHRRWRVTKPLLFGLRAQRKSPSSSSTANNRRSRALAG